LGIDPNLKETVDYNADFTNGEAAAYGHLLSYAKTGGIDFWSTIARILR